MQLDEDLYNSLYADLELCREYIRQISLGMISQAVSKYPIFIGMRGEMDIDLGLPMINRADFDITWSFNVSHLEDFVNRGIVSRDRVADFMKAYKNPKEYMCVFVAEEEARSFVFMPFAKENKITPGEGREWLN